MVHLLSGCGGNSHQVVADRNACLSCHNSSFAIDETAAYKMVNPVYSSTGELSVVVSGAKSFYVCQAMGTTQENKPPVPLLLRGPLSVTEGEPYEVSLEPGNYLLVIQDSGKVVSQLVIVDAATTQKTTDTITLKL